MPNSSNRPEGIEALCREATTCRKCFDFGTIQDAPINIAQPRWIGDGYWASSPRVCVVMLNPAAGAAHNEEANREMLALLQRFKSGETSIDEVFRFQRNDFKTWGKPPGRFLNFFRTFGLDIDNIALANVAWCATAGNDYPSWMLKKCMQKFTGRLIGQVNPDVVVLSGNKVHAYDVFINRSAPNAVIFRTLHFAHRDGHEAEMQESRRFREFLERFPIILSCTRP